MENVFELSLVFIVLSAIVGLIFKRLHRDKCLKDFEGFMVTVEEAGGKRIWGRLRVENTGLELVYPESCADEDGHLESSYIIYEFEYSNVAAIWRYHDELSAEGKKKREKTLANTYHPEGWRIALRKVGNLFKTLKDAVVEIVNLLMSRAKKGAAAGGVLTSQDKHVSKMKSDLMGAAGSSYEPLLERYVGHKVVLEMVAGEKIVEHCGVLKDYTAQFIEVMDVSLREREGRGEKGEVEETPSAKLGNEEDGAGGIRKADLVVLRKVGIVRHLGE